MSPRRHLLVVRREERGLLSVADVARRAGVHPQLVRHLVALGLAEPAAAEEELFAPEQAERVARAFRLRRDLGVNLVGCAVVLDLLERIEGLERELEALRGGR